MELLKTRGFSLDELWKMTPRQMGAWVSIGNRREARERRMLLALHAMAAQGDPKAIQKALKDGD